jgi:DeoR/GlpR family transcriptional regulator of sugar metabolism
MLVEERRQKLRDLISTHGFASLQDLARKIDVSESTIRRDLEHLHQMGYLRRTHGGAVWNQDGAPLPPLEERTGRQLEEKRWIGELASSLIQNGDTVLLDGGTTTLEVAREILGTGKRVQVVTNSLPIAQMFAANPGSDLVVLGGYVYPRTGVALGSSTMRMLEDLHAHVAILSAGGITKEGLFNSNLLLVETERAMMRRAERVIVVADHTKLGRRALTWLCALDDIDDLVVDDHVTTETRDWLEKAGIRLHVAKRACGYTT